MCAAIITSVSHADVLSLCQEPGGILRSIRNEKASVYWERLQGKSPAWDNGNVKDILASKGNDTPCHCRCERKSSDLKTFCLCIFHHQAGNLFPWPVPTVFMPQLLQELDPSCLCSHFTSLELLPCRPVFYKLNMLFLTLLTSCKCSVFHLPLHSARLSLSTLTLRSQTWSVTPFLSIISEISLLIHPRISFAFLCLTSQSGCSHSDHRVLDHLLLIISYIIPQTITNPHIPDLSSPTFCLHSHFNYSDSQGHLVLSAFYSHSSLRCQNFQFCVLGDFSLRILLALPRSSTRKDQFPTCSVRKSFGKFSPENWTSPYSLLILLSFSFTNNFPRGTYQIPDWSLDKGDQQHFLCLENQVFYQNKAIMFVWHNLHFVNSCCILSHFPFISAYLIVLPFKFHFETSSQG